MENIISGARLVATPGTVASHLPPSMRLCVASDITGENQSIITRAIGQWRQAQYDYHKIPTIFLLFN